MQKKKYKCFIRIQLKDVNNLLFKMTSKLKNIKIKMTKMKYKLIIIRSIFKHTNLFIVD